jgi:hypothetical protein
LFIIALLISHGVGSGILKRLIVSMEKFIIPTLVKIVAKNKAIAGKQNLDFPGENEKIVINIVGHSRGMWIQRIFSFMYLLTYLFYFCLNLFI